MTLGILGVGFIDSGQPGGASFGFNGNDPVVIRFIPEPSAAALAIFAVAAVTCSVAIATNQLQKAGRGWDANRVS